MAAGLSLGRQHVGRRKEVRVLDEEPHARGRENRALMAHAREKSIKQLLRRLSLLACLLACFALLGFAVLVTFNPPEAHPASCTGVSLCRGALGMP